MNITRIASQLATLGPIGRLPARGTIASLLTTIFLYATGPCIAPCWMPSIAIITIGSSFIIIHYALPYFSSPDPAEIVLDEVAGTVCALYIFPHTLVWMGFGFLIFRFFDIVKPLGIKHIERLPGAAGIVFDDVLAGFYTQVVLIGSVMIHALCTGH